MRRDGGFIAHLSHDGRHRREAGRNMGTARDRVQARLGESVWLGIC